MTKSLDVWSMPMPRRKTRYCSPGGAAGKAGKEGKEGEEGKEGKEVCSVALSTTMESAVKAVG